MYGLAAIEQANGWAMAGAGACIVLAGLTLLSFLISLLPRIPGISDKKAEIPAKPVEAPPAPPKMAPERLPDDINDAAKILVELTEELGESFTLIDLHCKCKAVDLPNPHMAIKRFRDTGLLMSLGDGLFCWKPISE
jgi:hypothetical protein